MSTKDLVASNTPQEGKQISARARGGKVLRAREIDDGTYRLAAADGVEVGRVRFAHPEEQEFDGKQMGSLVGVVQVRKLF